MNNLSKTILRTAQIIFVCAIVFAAVVLYDRSTEALNYRINRDRLADLAPRIRRELDSRYLIMDLDLPMTAEVSAGSGIFGILNRETSYTFTVKIKVRKGFDDWKTQNQIAQAREWRRQCLDVIEHEEKQLGPRPELTVLYVNSSKYAYIYREYGDERKYWTENGIEYSLKKYPELFGVRQERAEEIRAEAQKKTWSNSNSSTSRWSTSSESRPSSGYRGNPYNTYGSFPYPGGGSVTDTDFYDSGDYDNALDFADDWAEEFAEEWDGDLEEGWNDAYEYWEENHG